MSRIARRAWKSEVIRPYARMPSSSGFPYKLTLALALTIAFDTVVQLVWKKAAEVLPETPSWDVVEIVFNQPLFYLVVALSLAQLTTWLSVLRQSDLSFAQPFTAFSRVTVCLASVYFLHEQISPEQIAGIGLVCAGAWFISLTPRQTGDSERPPS
jgi:uncharacterized membrane protein